MLDFDVDDSEINRTSETTTSSQRKRPREDGSTSRDVLGIDGVGTHFSGLTNKIGELSFTFQGIRDIMDEAKMAKAKERAEKTQEREEKAKERALRLSDPWDALKEIPGIDNPTRFTVLKMLSDKSVRKSFIRMNIEERMSWIDFNLLPVPYIPIFEQWEFGYFWTKFLCYVSTTLCYVLCGHISFGPSYFVMLLCFYLEFLFVLARWEGLAHDTKVLNAALTKTNPMTVPQGGSFLLHSEVCAIICKILMVRGRHPENGKELFNLRHASLRNNVERIFGIFKSRFTIFKSAPPFLYKNQVDMVLACVGLHNFLRKECRSYEFPLTTSHFLSRKK